MGKQTLFVCAGHGGTDPGNTATGVVERDELIGIVGGMRRWATLLQVPQGLGGVVFLDDGLDLPGQVRVLQRWGASAADGDLAVDLHLDYRRDRPGGGALVIHNGVGGARTLGAEFLRRWCAHTGTTSNGVHLGREVAPAWRGWKDFGWTRQRWPAVIVELGSLNSERDMATVRDPFCQALALMLLQEVWRA